MPDVLTESDLFMNLDTSSLLLPSLNLEPESKQPGGFDFSSQLLPDTQPRASQEPARLEDHTLVDLDLGEDDIPLGNDFSIIYEYSQLYMYTTSCEGYFRRIIYTKNEG